MKVLLLKLFSGQVMLHVRDEPVCICAGPDGSTVVVATRTGFVEVHQVVEERTKLLHRFPCAGVRQVALLDSSHLAVLVEDSITGLLGVRVHAMLDGAVVSAIGTPVEHVAVCQRGSRRLLVCNGNGAWLWQFTNEQTLEPVAELAAAVALPRVCGDVLAFCSRDGRRTHVLRVAVQRDIGSSEAEAPETDDAEWAFPLCTTGVGAALLLRPASRQLRLGPQPNVDIAVTAEPGWRLVVNETLLAHVGEARIHSLGFSRDGGRFFLADADEATLYSLQGSACCELARYVFTAPTCGATVDDCFLYAIQSARGVSAASALEAYTLRQDVRLVAPSLEMPPPCLVTSVPLIGLHSVVGVGDSGSVALMSKHSSGTDVFWSVSMLAPEPLSAVWRELVLKGGSHDDTFALLHLEGWQLLRARGQVQLAQDASRMLADHFDKAGLFGAAVSFWTLAATVTIDEVTRRLLHQRQAAMALSDFLVAALERRDPRLATVGVGIGNSLLEHLARHRPTSVPNAVLTCSLAHDASLAIELLVRLGSDEERFARAYCHALVGDAAAATKAIRAVGSADVVTELLRQYEDCWLRDGQLTAFGAALLSESGLAVLEAVKDRPLALAQAVLGSARQPLLLMYLERVVVDYHARPLTSPATTAPARHALDSPQALEEAISLLARGYIAIHDARYPFGEADERRFLVDLEETPVTTRWPVRHWHWLRPPRWIRTDSGPPFYVAKLQGLLILARATAPKLAFSLAREAPQLPPTLVAACSLLWSSPFAPSAEHADAFFALPRSIVTGYCREYCQSLGEWRDALRILRERGCLDAHRELVLHCVDLFSAQELVLLLPHDEPLATQTTFLWSAARHASAQQLLLSMIAYVEAQSVASQQLGTK